MEMEKIRAEATRQGVRDSALEDIENRARKAFSSQPEAGVLDVWMRQQIEKSPFLLDPRTTTAQLPAALQGHLPEQITWARAQGQVPVYDRERRRFHPTPPQALTEAWNKLPPSPRRTAQLEWEAAQQQGQG
jgi:hypothetical protein